MDNMDDMEQLLSPVTPGELLKEEFLVPMGISQYRLAKETGIPAQRIGQIVLGRRAVTADTDLRLCRFFGLTDGYWLRAQVAYDIEVAKRKLLPELEKIVPWSSPAEASKQGSGSPMDGPCNTKESSSWQETDAVARGGRGCAAGDAAANEGAPRGALRRARGDH